ncbi:MAG: LLM class flavin-dependent oxidoreductase [Anaerolineales bacterium]|nr:LLM class flavin-dependent oxidoreductase [Anaerolineales bacterium]
MTQRVALYLQDKHNMAYELEMARYAEERGFSEIWQADTRLARDCIVMMSAFLTHTRRLRIGSGVLPIWTRNPAVIAATWSTMWELGGLVDGRGRVMLGLGAWWEPIASRVGETRTKPLKAIREHVEAIRQLFTMQEVTYRGEFVNLDRIKLDVAYGNPGPRDIPIYVGATGEKMLELSGEICNGVVLNYMVSVEYIRKAISLVEKGAQKAGKTLAEVDLPELIVCSLSDQNPQAAMAEAKKLTAYYLATEPHIMKASQVAEELLEKVQSMVGWPATEADYARASQVIPDEVARTIMAVGTSDECRKKVSEYVDAGVTCPILYPLMDDIKAVVDAFADRF